MMNGHESRLSVTLRLEELRRALRAENISYGELAELQSLARFIEPSDAELREAAGEPEFCPTCADPLHGEPACSLCKFLLRS